MDIGQIIILVVYGLGTLITAKHLRGKISALETQVNSQSEILSSVKKYMSIFDLDRVEKYVKMSEKIILMEKEEAVKAVEKEMESKADKSVQFLLTEFRELIRVMLRLSAAYAINDYFEKVINEMKDVEVKKFLLKELHEDKARMKAHGIDINDPAQRMYLALLMADKTPLEDRAGIKIEKNDQH